MAEFMASTSPVVPMTPRRATFHGRGGTLFGIYLRNILLTILTLGVYYFWGRNRTRTYVVGQCAFEGDRFAWHGSGRELFIGALKLLLFVVPIVALAVAAQLYWKNELAESVVGLVFYVASFLLVPAAVVGSRRYRMSRLSWRGIRFSFRGRIRDCFKLFLRGSFLMGLTFGLHYPFFQTNIRRFVTGHSYFGNTRFGYDGRGGDIFGRFLVVIAVSGAAFGSAAFLLFRAFMRRPSVFFLQPEVTDVIPVLLQGMVPLLVAAAVVMVVWFWFAAYRHRYNWAHTSFGTARFRSTMTTGRLIAQTLTNLLLLVVTLGLAWSWVTVRNLNFHLANIILDGPLNLAGIVQEAQAAGATGESLADVLDIDFLGFELPL